MINPLDLPGPQFLVLYAVFGVAVLYVLWMLQSSGEGGAPPRLDMSDPYRLAYLRGGASEAARVATVALIDRGLLTVEDDKVKSTPDRHEPRAPLEGAIVRACAQPHLITQVCGAADVIAATERYEKELVRLTLLPDDATRSARSRRLTVAIAILGALSAAKLGVALSRGRTNVGFLIILTIVFVVIAIKLTRRSRTARGNALLADMRRLFSRLRARAGEFQPGYATTDLTLAAAVFGVAVLPSARFAYVKRVFPKAKSSSSPSCGGTSCGTSCGGGGGGDGGGGCGGCGGGGGGGGGD